MHFYFVTVKGLNSYDILWRLPGGHWYEISEFTFMGYEISGKIWVLSAVWIVDSFLSDAAICTAAFVEGKCCGHSHLFGSGGNGIILYGRSEEHTSELQSQ